MEQVQPKLKIYFFTFSMPRPPMLHSQMKHRERMLTLNRFKSSSTKILVATDVASRGLDIPACNLVVNHNIPADEKTFVHRVGRTARAGKKGVALSLLSVWDINRVKNIEKYTNSTMTEIEPDDEKVAKIMVQTRMLRADCEIKLRNVQNEYAEKKKRWNSQNKRKSSRQASKVDDSNKKAKKLK